MMHRIGIISDTHGLLRPEVADALQGCDAILHGGDISSPAILEKLNEIAPTYAVRGNNDKEWAKGLPETLSVELYGIRFFMVHNKKYIPKDLDNVDIIVYGHSHKYEEKRMDGRLMLNPGSCGPRRFTQPITFAVLETAGDTSYQIEKMEIAYKTGNSSAAKMNAAKTNAAKTNVVKTGAEKIGVAKANAARTNSTEKDLLEEIHSINVKKTVKAVMRDTDKKLSVTEIAAKNGISEELAKQICRLYLTHPGVSADGIMGKMGL